MNKRLSNYRNLVCVFFFIIVIQSTGAQKMSNFIGANITREDPVRYLNCVGFAREFHSWVLDEGSINLTNITPGQGENNCFDGMDNDGDLLIDCDDIGDCACASGLYPFNNCKWNPGYQGISNEIFHDFYGRIAAQLRPSSPTLVPICVSLNSTLPQLLDFTPTMFEEAAAAEYKPIFPPGSPTTTPSSYLYYADYVTQYCKHFGGASSTDIPSKQPDQPFPQHL